jgi:branched-chain amino acid transport system permease protein
MQGQELRQALVTIGLSIIIADQMLANFGGSPFQFFAPDILFGPMEVPGVGRYSTFRAVPDRRRGGRRRRAVAAAQQDRLGIMVRAGVDDRQMLAACGINVPLVAVVRLRARRRRSPASAASSAPRPAHAARRRREIPADLARRRDRRRHGLHPGTAIGAILIGLTEQWGQALFRPIRSSSPSRSW